jgi:hypothetical protein
MSPVLAQKSFLQTQRGRVSDPRRNVDVLKLDRGPCNGRRANHRPSPAEICEKAVGSWSRFCCVPGKLEERSLGCFQSIKPGVIEA